MKTALAQYQTTHDIVQIETAKIDDFERKLSYELDGYCKLLNGVKDHLSRIRSLQYLVDYFKIIKDIQDVGYEQHTS